MIPNHSNMDFSTSITHIRNGFIVSSMGENSWGSTAKESCDGAIADFVADGGVAEDIIEIETVDLREEV